MEMIHLRKVVLAGFDKIMKRRLKKVRALMAKIHASSYHLCLEHGYF